MMKIRTLILTLSGILLITFSSTVFNKAVGQSNVYQHDTISMEPGRTHDVFYSLKNGEVAKQPRSDWDIEFSTNVYDVTIRINGTQGVALYAYPYADISGWNAIDTTGLFLWPALNNSDKNWETGAFNVNSTGSDLDYGWGVYNIISHNIIGDSLFVMQLPSGNFLKLWIVEKNAPLNQYTFKYANLDGTNENQVVFTCNDYKSKNFIGYSFATGEFVDREPASMDWDLLFTKYMTFYQNIMWYPVTGLLQNYNVQAASYPQVDTAFMDFSVNALDSANISTIGNYWNTYQGGTYTVFDSLVYFVSDQESSIWKLVFEYYTLSSVGKIGFRKMLVEDHAGIIETQGSANGKIALSPNPATSDAQLLFNADKPGMAEISIINLTGQTVYRRNISYVSGLNNSILDVSELPQGVYVVMLRSGNTILQNKLIKN